MPGLVFDERKHRLGYGYGHYDYFLSRYFAHFDRHIGKVKLSKARGIFCDLTVLIIIVFIGLCCSWSSTR